MGRICQGNTKFDISFHKKFQLWIDMIIYGHVDVCRSLCITDAAWHLLNNWVIIGSGIITNILFKESPLEYVDHKMSAILS